MLVTITRTIERRAKKRREEEEEKEGEDRRKGRGREDPWEERNWTGERIIFIQCINPLYIGFLVV